MLKRGPGSSGGGGGGGSPSILVETGASEKISAMTNLPNPPPALVYDSVITYGSPTLNYARPQGVIVQPEATGASDGNGITLKAGTALGTGNGGALNISAGYAYGDAATGGRLLFNAGSVYGDHATGGNLAFQAGNATGSPATGAGYASYGGSLSFSGGASQYGIPGGLALNGGSGRSRYGGSVSLNPGYAAYGPPGVLQVASSASVLPMPQAWHAGDDPNGWTVFTATRAMRVAAIIGRVDAANGATATLTVVKVPSGTAIGSGTALTTNTLDANGSANTNQTLTLKTDTAAATTLTFTGQPANGQTVTISSGFDERIYTFQTVLTNVGGHIQIGADATGSITNLVAAMSLGGTPGTDYAAATHANAFLSAVVGVGSTADFTARQVSAGANTIPTATNVTGASWTGATVGDGTPGTATTLLAAGDSIALKSTGSWVLASGAVTIWLTLTP